MSSNESTTDNKEEEGETTVWQRMRDRTSQYQTRLEHQRYYLPEWMQQQSVTRQYQNKSQQQQQGTLGVVDKRVDFDFKKWDSKTNIKQQQQDAVQWPAHKRRREKDPQQVTAELTEEEKQRSLVGRLANMTEANTGQPPTT